MNPEVMILKSPPGSNTRVVSRALSIPGAFSEVMLFADRLKFPSESVVPSKNVSVVVLYQLYPGKVVLPFESRSSVITFKLLVFAPCIHRV